MADFADRLKLLRKMRDLSLSELAAQLGTTKQTLNRYELKKRFPKAPVIKQFAEKLNVDPAWLIGYDDETKHDGTKKDMLCKLLERLNDDQLDLIIGIADNIVKNAKIS